MSDNNGHRTLRRVLLIALAIGAGLFLRYNHAYFFQHGMFQRQQSDYHMNMTTYEDAGLTLQIPEDWERRENPKSAKWNRDTLYLREYQNFSDDGKYFALATVEVRRQHKLRQQGEVLPELALYQKYGLYHEYKEVEVPGYPLAYRQDFSFAPVVDDDPGTIGTTQVVFTENQAVEVTVMGNKGYLAHSDIKAILDAVDYSEFKELD